MDSYYIFIARNKNISFLVIPIKKDWQVALAVQTLTACF